MSFNRITSKLNAALQAKRKSKSDLDLDAAKEIVEGFFKSGKNSKNDLLKAIVLLDSLGLLDTKNDNVENSRKKFTNVLLKSYDGKEKSSGRQLQRKIEFEKLQSLYQKEANLKINDTQFLLRTAAMIKVIDQNVYAGSKSNTVKLGNNIRFNPTIENINIALNQVKSIVLQDQKVITTDSDDLQKNVKASRESVIDSSIKNFEADVKKLNGTNNDGIIYQQIWLPIFKMIDANLGNSKLLQQAFLNSGGYPRNLKEINDFFNNPKLYPSESIQGYDTNYIGAERYAYENQNQWSLEGAYGQAKVQDMRDFITRIFPVLYDGKDMEDKFTNLNALPVKLNTLKTAPTDFATQYEEIESTIKDIKNDKTVSPLRRIEDAVEKCNRTIVQRNLTDLMAEIKRLKEPNDGLIYHEVWKVILGNSRLGINGNIKAIETFGEGKKNYPMNEAELRKHLEGKLEKKELDFLVSRFKSLYERANIEGKMGQLTRSQRALENYQKNLDSINPKEALKQINKDIRGPLREITPKSMDDRATVTTKEEKTYTNPQRFSR